MTEEHYRKLEELERGSLAPREAAAIDYVTQFTIDPAGMHGDLFTALLSHFSRAQAVEIAVFAAWQANGLRAIDSWGAEVLLNSLDVPLAYADGPSLFVPGAPDPAHHDDGNFPVVDEVVPLPNPTNAADDETVEAIRQEWTDWGCPPERWLRFLSAAPHVLWGWSNFHRLTFQQGALPRRTQALVIALLSVMIDYEEWAAGLLDESKGWGVSAADREALRSGRFDRFDPTSAAALTYAHRLEADYSTIDDAFFESVAVALGPGELVELGNLAGMHMGSIRLARFLSTHQIDPW